MKENRNNIAVFKEFLDTISAFDAPTFTVIDDTTLFDVLDECGDKCALVYILILSSYNDYYLHPDKSSLHSAECVGSSGMVTLPYSKTETIEILNTLQDCGYITWEYSKYKNDSATFVIDPIAEHDRAEYLPIKFEVEEPEEDPNELG